MNKLLLKSFITLAAITAIVFFFTRSDKPIIASNGPLLSGFEDTKIWDISPEKGFDISLSKDHVTQGEYSLKVVYPIADLPSINTKKLRDDWGVYTQVDIDIFNPQDEDIPFTIRLDDKYKKRGNINYTLKPGMNHVSIDRRKISRYIEPEIITRVVMFIKYPAKRVTLYFDNMRLEGADASSANGISKEKIEELRKGFIDKEEFVPIVPFNPFPKKGVIKCNITKYPDNNGSTVLVSTGVPFAPGQLFDENNVAFFDADSEEIPVWVEVLARWPHDGSIRSILVRFNADIEHKYKVIYLKWGEKYEADRLPVEEVSGIPAGLILLPAQWLSYTGITGPQVPFGKGGFPAYDENIIKRCIALFGQGPTQNIRTQGYYDVTHVLYQIYSRTGDDRYFKLARREALNYRKQVIKEGPMRGRHKKYGKTRYIYMQGMIDDYLFTGDPESLKVAGYMAEYLKKNYSPEKAYFGRHDTRFWTEREQAFPLIDLMSWYELTGDKEALDISGEIVRNLYRTQREWPERGGFIHNLYSHDPEEGARRDEYGGSPFMTGLLLEGIIKYHEATGSNIAKDSIFRALDWLMKECLAPGGDTFVYTTAAAKKGEGVSDLNLLIAHAFGYGYKISGYNRTDYLEMGNKLFDKGVKSAYLGTGKHFNQNYRSSGHYLSYVTLAEGEK